MRGSTQRPITEIMSPRAPTACNRLTSKRLRSVTARDAVRERQPTRDAARQRPRVPCDDQVSLIFRLWDLDAVHIRYRPW